MRNRLLMGGAALAAFAMLTGCNRTPRAPEPAPTPTATQSENPAPVSIIRDDIDVEREAPPLAPLEARIGFPDGGSKLSQAALAALATVAESPQVAAGGAITLRGHSDSAGTDSANLRVSQVRAEAVRDWLVAHGIAAERVTVIALGEQNPVQPNALPDGSENAPGRAANRRVDITVAVPAGAPSVQPAGPSETLVDELVTPGAE